MSGLFYLAAAYAWHNLFRTAILILCIAVSIFLPLVAQVLITQYRAGLTTRADQTPLIMGSKGNRFDLTLTALYFRPSTLEPVPVGECDRLRDMDLGTVIPISTKFTARGYPLIATSLEYFELRNLRLAAGAPPAILGECVVGANVARVLKLAPGGYVFSDQRELYDISKPPALKMHVVGVFLPTGGPDDDAVFVDSKTAWVLDGLAHGHDEPQKMDASLVLQRTEKNVALSEAMIEYHEITPENIASFHIHGDPDKLPLTAAIIVPMDAKSATLLKARINASPTSLFQVVVPRDVIDDLVAFVFRIKSLFDAIAAVLAGSTLLLTVLIGMLSARLRAREFETFHRIGASRFTVAKLYAIEFGGILIISTLLAAAATWATAAWLPSLVRSL